MAVREFFKKNSGLPGSSGDWNRVEQTGKGPLESFMDGPGAASGGGMQRSMAMGSAQTGDAVQIMRNQFTQGRHWVETGCSLNIVVKQAYNIGNMGSAPDPYVRLYLGPQDTSDCDIKGTTRVVYRNRNPIIEESFTFPLKGQPLDDTTYLTCLMMSYDQIKDSFLGQFQWRLSMLLGTLKAIGVPIIEKYPLTDRSAEDLMPGELELQLTVLPPTANPEYIPTGKDLYSTATLQRRFGARNLQLNVRAIHGLRTVASAEEVAKSFKDLRLEVRVGTVAVRQPVNPQQLIAENATTHMSTLTLRLDHKIVIPLAGVFTIPPPPGLIIMPLHAALSTQRRKVAQELGDVRIYLVSGTVSVCKAQFPLWKLLEDVNLPTKVSSPSKPLDSAASALRTLPEDGERMTAPRAPLGPDGERVAGTRVRRMSSPGMILGITKRASRVDMMVPQGPEPFLEAAPEQELNLPMERYGKGLVHPVEMELTAELVTPSPTAQAPADGAAVVVPLGDDDMEDVASAPPLDKDLIPPPLPTLLLQDEFPCGPCRMYSVVVTPGSTLMNNIFEKENLTNVVVPEWSKDSPRTRQVTYVRKLNIPLGPKSCNVTESQRLVTMVPGGWVMEIDITTSAPKGDLFVVKCQVVVLKAAATTTSSTMRVSLQVEWIKSAGMLKGIIEGASTRDSKAHWQMVAAAVKAIGTGPAPVHPGALGATNTPGDIIRTVAAQDQLAVQMGGATGTASWPTWLRPIAAPVFGADAVQGLLRLCGLLLALVVVLLLMLRGGRAGKGGGVTAASVVRAGAGGGGGAGAGGEVERLERQLEMMRGVHERTVDGMTLALQVCRQVLDAGAAAVAGGGGAGKPEL